MLPSIRPEQVFSRTCDEYTSYLGGSQAEAFRLVWTIHDAQDILKNGNEAASLIHRELALPFELNTVKIAPLEVVNEMYREAERVGVWCDERAAHSWDLKYADLLYKIAFWQHEDIGEHVDSFVNDLRHPEMPPPPGRALHPLD